MTKMPLEQKKKFNQSTWKKEKTWEIREGIKLKREYDNLEDPDNRRQCVLTIISST
jgi:hypothetical protein